MTAIKKSSMQNLHDENEKKANRDPITGEPGSHPVATSVGTVVGSGVGVAAAIAIGATSGAMLGPIGAAVGAVVGGIFGAGVGHQVGEDIYPTQISWWEGNYQGRPYVKAGESFSTYEPAYWYGIHAATRSEQEFENLEPSLRNNWNLARGNSTLEWDEARSAARDAYDRMRAARTGMKQ